MEKVSFVVRGKGNEEDVFVVPVFQSAVIRLFLIEDYSDKAKDSRVT